MKTCDEQILGSMKHMPALQKIELFTTCFYEFQIPNPDFWAYFFRQNIQNYQQQSFWLVY